MASRWRSDYNGIFVFRCVQAWILIERVKSGADRTLYGWVTTTFIPMARHRNLWCRQGHALNENSRSSQFNITKAFRLDWPKYYVYVIKSLGGVSYRVKQCHFLLPAGGAMTITEYGHLDLFRSGFLSNMWSWCRSDIACLRYNNFLFHGETSKFDRTPRTRPPMKTLDLPQFNVTKGFRLQWPILVFIRIKSLGGVR